ncbi:hypothetical protein PENSPDRAFT_163308 [Peniophora sp. CONT]|nr:hypothetical protein PENSPDRAFT_163308 [Peniophora sp. CONT]
MFRRAARLQAGRTQWTPAHPTRAENEATSNVYLEDFCSVVSIPAGDRLADYIPRIQTEKVQVIRASKRLECVRLVEVGNMVHDACRRQNDLSHAIQILPACSSLPSTSSYPLTCHPLRRTYLALGGDCSFRENVNPGLRWSSSGQPTHIVRWTPAKRRSNGYVDGQDDAHVTNPRHGNTSSGYGGATVCFRWPTERRQLNCGSGWESLASLVVPILDMPLAACLYCAATVVFGILCCNALCIWAISVVSYEVSYHNLDS